MTAMPPRKLASFGRVGYGLAMAAFGVTHLVHAGFVTRMVPPLPGWVAGPSIWAVVLGAALLAAGLSIALGKRGTRIAALAVGSVIVVSLLFLRLPLVFENPGFGGAWTNPCKYSALAGGAFLIASLYSRKRPPQAGAIEAATSVDWLARALLGGFLTLGGIQHFVYSSFVAKMVPGWIPGRLFWAYFAGAALVASGVGLLIARTARPAALLSGAMILSWFLLVHVPRVVSSAGDPGEWSGLFESLATSGVAWLIAGTGRGRSAPARGPVLQ